MVGPVVRCVKAKLNGDSVPDALELGVKTPGLGSGRGRSSQSRCGMRRGWMARIRARLRGGIVVLAMGGMVAVGMGSCTPGTGVKDARAHGDASVDADANANANANVDASADVDAHARAHAHAKVRRVEMRGATREMVCAGAVAEHGEARAGVTAFERASGSCAGNFCDVAETPPKGADACFVASSNIARAERESAGVRRGAIAQSKAWDKKSAPRFFDRVDAHLHLDERESSLLRANGFVVLDRLGYESYAVAFHDVFQQQLPVYVGVDAVFNAVFQASQTVLGEVERTRLGPKLVSMIDTMRATLGQSRGRYDPETVDDLDLYMVVAHRLLHPWSDAKARTPEGEALA